MAGTDAASPFKTAEERGAERSAKRRAVLRAAVRMFNDRGFQAASLDDVAASIGISKRTIYHYLGSKDQVLLECVTTGLDQLLIAAEETRHQPGTGRQRLIQFLRRYAAITMEDFGRCVIRTGEEALAPESRRHFRRLKRGIDQAMRNLIEEAVADGSMAPIDVRLAAFTLAGALNWAARWHDPEGPQSPDQIAVAMVDMLMGGMAPPA